MLHPRVACNTVSVRYHRQQQKNNASFLHTHHFSGNFNILQINSSRMTTLFRPVFSCEARPCVVRKTLSTERSPRAVSNDKTFGFTTTIVSTVQENRNKLYSRVSHTTIWILIVLVHILFRHARRLAQHQHPSCLLRQLDICVDVLKTRICKIWSTVDSKRRDALSIRAATPIRRWFRGYTPCLNTPVDMKYRAITPAFGPHVPIN